MKTKIVDVKAIAPVTGVKGFVRGTRKNIELSTADIWKCICARAEVYEHLNDGTLLRLNGHNYNTENNTTPAPAVTPAPAAVEERPTEIINKVPEIPAIENKDEKVADEPKPTDVITEKSITDAIDNAEDGDEIVLNAELATEEVPVVDATTANVVDTDAADDMMVEDATSVEEETPAEPAPAINPYSGKHKNKNRK